MNRELEKRCRELEKNISVLQNENELLSERAEDSLLISLIADSIRSIDDSDVLCLSILERISILKDIQYCACCELRQNKIIQNQVYAGFSDTDFSGSEISLSPEIIKELDDGLVYITSGSCSQKGIQFNFKNSDFEPFSTCIFPFTTESIPEGFFIFADDEPDEAKLSAVSMLLQNIIDMVVEKLDKITLLEELKQLNTDLDRKIKSRTKSLIETNKRLSQEISDRIKAENETIQVQKLANEHEKLALVGQVAGKMAHDFNNVLGIIMGNAELSLLDCNEPQTKKTLELIYKQTIRGKNLTKNLIAFAQDQEPKQEFFKINEKINLVIDLLKKDLDGIELIRKDKANVPEVLADPGMIEHTLVNLIQNAIHTTSMTEHPKVIIKTYCLENNICFEIADNGCGIPEEHLQHIYEPSFTLKGNKDVTGSYDAKIKGTGYGMANVKKYVERHKGRMSIRTEFGSGTVFIVHLPIIKKQLSKKEKQELHKSEFHSGDRILLVEDETDISDVQYTILTQDPCNHKVDLAHNGLIAMDLFDRNEYDFVSLDYILPGGINGMDVYNHIRKTNTKIPILFISGNIEFLESIRELKQKDRYVDHLSKPCKNIDYINSIDKLLGI